MLNQSAFVFCGFQPRLELFKRKVHGAENASNMENDFVVVLPGMILAIECKTTLDSGQFKKALKQFSGLKQVLEEELGLGHEFKFVKCLAYQKTERGYEQSEDCQKCQPYLLKWSEKKDFKAKILTLIKDVPAEPLNLSHFKNAVRDLLIFTSKREDGSDAEIRVADAFFQRHNQIINTPAETVFFWDPEQYDIIKKDKKYVILRGSKYLT